MFVNTDTQKKNERTGWMISVIVHLLLLMLFFSRILIDNNPPVEEGGITIALGIPDAGMTEDVSLESTNTPSSAAPPPSPEPEVTANSNTSVDDSPVLAANKKPKPKQAETPPSSIKTNADAEAKKRKQQEEAATKEKAAADAKKKQFSDLLKKSNPGNNNNSGSQGQANGDPNASNLDGIAKGSGRIGGGLSGRGVVYEPQFVDRSQKTGKVNLSICVDATGKVSKAEFTQKGSTTSDPYLIDLARRTSLKYKFTASEITSQCGTVSVDFKVQ
jgi:periplasmic protein TonB